MASNNKQEDIEPVVRRYSNMLYRVCFLILKNEQDVRDVLQETFLKYIEKKPVFKSEEQRKLWLVKVSQNKCKEFLRFHKRHSYIPFEEVENSVMITDGLDFDSKETIAYIWNLDPKLKSAIILYYIEGYSVKEVAGILSISETAVKKRLQRGREKMKLYNDQYSGGLAYETR